MKTKFNILVTDDDAYIQFAFKEVLLKDGHSFQQASNAGEALQLIKENKPDIIFMDIGMPGMDGLEALRHINSYDNKIPVIIITGEGTLQTAIQAMQYGAFQYLVKPLSLQSIRTEISKVAININTSSAKNNFTAESSKSYQLLGNNRSMHEIFKTIGLISTTDNHTNVLITGETGTGKELIARAVHNNSQNRTAPFIAINCAAMPENLLESELFGHEKGAFTGAVNQKIGKFELVEDGTLFLDEIGDLSVELQKKLLRVLQQREFERVGATRLIAVKARFIAATNQDLEAKTKIGAFRKDLYYRLNVVYIKAPPLRERKDDIPLLANFFLSRYRQNLGKKIDSISDGAMAKLEAYDYPGNIRELENIIERAVMLTRNNIILPYAITDFKDSKSETTDHLKIVSSNFTAAKDYIISQFESQFISQQLKQFHGNISAAAVDCNMSRQNFYRLMIKYNISSDDI